MGFAFSGSSNEFDLRSRPRSGANVVPHQLQAKEQLQRILVTFKDNSAPRSSSQAPVEQRMKDRMTTSASEASAGKVRGLTYLRAVSGMSHVYLTDTSLDRTSMQTVIQALANDPAIASVSIDERMVPHAFSPNDSAFVDSSNPQWYLKAPSIDIGAANFANAWNRVTSASVPAPISGENVVVAVLDSGYLPHVDLAANLLSGYDFIRLDSNGFAFTANDSDGRDNDARDPGDWNTNTSACAAQPNSSWHGTRVAGIIAAVTDNASGMAGAAYKANVLPLRVLGVCGGYISDVVDAMRWAAGIPVNGLVNNANPAKVINLSLGGRGICASDSEYQKAIDDVRTIKNVTVVVSTGNDSSDTTITQPANCNNVIAVTAHKRDATSPVFANVGAGTTISAPGVDIYSTSNDGTQGPGLESFALADGTSFSAPLVSSVAAMLYQVKPGITPDEVTSRLINSVRSFPVSTFCSGNYLCGAGLLDADAAIALALADDAPYANAYASKSNNVARGTSITLTGVAGAGSSGTGLATVQWTQISGPTVTISNASGNVATILTPAASSDVNLVFRFRATTLSPNAKTADSYVTVNMASASVASSGGGGGGGGGGGSLEYLSLLGLAVLALLAHLGVPKARAKLN